MLVQLVVCQEADYVSESRRLAVRRWGFSRSFCRAAALLDIAVLIACGFPWLLRANAIEVLGARSSKARSRFLFEFWLKGRASSLPLSFVNHNSL